MMQESKDDNKGGEGDKGAAAPVAIDYDKLAEAIVAKQQKASESKDDKKEQPKKATEAAQHEVAEKEKTNQQVKEIEGAVSFNKNLPDFLEKNEEMFGTKDFVRSLRAEIERRAEKDGTESDKAATRALNLLDAFCARKEDVERLPAQVKAKVDQWNATADSAKPKLALSNFKEIIELAAEIRSASAKDRALAVKHGLDGKVGGDEIEKKIWAHAEQNKVVFK